MLNHVAIINPRLLAALADLRHGDVVVIADAGLPAPSDERVIDLSLVAGVPSFASVAEVILDALVVESAVVAVEGAGCEPLAGLRGRLEPAQIPHEQFKRLTETARFIVRTGEHTPFANAALVAGVAFPTPGRRPEHKREGAP